MFDQTNLKKQLIGEKIIHFDNSEWDERTQSDEPRSGWIQHRECFGKMEFHIWFNAKLIHSSKGWTSCEKKMNELFEKWNCEITAINDEI